MDAQVDGACQLTTNSGDEDQPYVSGDGNRILYKRKVSGGFEIRHMNSDGGDDRLIKRIETSYGIVLSGWVPDGSGVLVAWNDPICWLKSYKMALDGSYSVFLALVGHQGHDVALAPDRPELQGQAGAQGMRRRDE